jgi:hypothetical protein
VNAALKTPFAKENNSSIVKGIRKIREMGGKPKGKKKYHA